MFGKHARRALLLPICLLVSAIAFGPSLRNDFLNWDDQAYVVYNPLIRDLSPESIGKIFSTLQYMGNYHPLTLLSYAIDLHTFGQAAEVFHGVNLLLHLANIALVFVLLSRLSGKKEVAFIGGLIFGLHPLHVESVAWIAARKDLLYTLFYLASLVCYVKAVAQGTADSDRRRLLVGSICFFFLSLLSKAMAVPLPLVLFLIDLWERRKITRATILEKAPFFVLSMVFGVIAFAAQQASHSVITPPIQGLFGRFLLAGYAFSRYLILCIAPLNLSGFYPYPKDLNLLTYAGGGAGILLMSWIVIFTVRLFAASRPQGAENSFARVCLFGGAFFIANIIFVLQLVPVGRALMADRYTYLPLAGFSLAAAEGIVFLWKRASTRNLSGAVAILVTAYALWLGILTAERCGVWKDSVAFWTSVLNRYPDVPEALKGRASAYLELGNPGEASADYDALLRLSPEDPEAFTGKGSILVAAGEAELALGDFTRAIRSDPHYALAYYNRGCVYAQMSRMDSAVADFDRAIAAKPDYGDAFVNRGIARLNANDTNGACEDFRRAAQLGHEEGTKLFRQVCSGRIP